MLGGAPVLLEELLSRLRGAVVRVHASVHHADAIRTYALVERQQRAGDMPMLSDAGAIRTYIIIE